MSESVQEYLEAIYSFNENKKPATNRQLSKRLKVAPPSITNMLQKLAKNKMIEYSRYKGVVLTGKGNAIAQKVVRRHRLLESYLYKELGLDKELIHDEACKLEHTISEEVSSALCRKINNPKVCPDDGNPIPLCVNLANCPDCPTSNDSNRLITRLSNLVKDEKCIIIHVEEGLNTELSIGHEIIVKNAELFYGPMEILIFGVKKIIERSIAEKIHIEIQSDAIKKNHSHGPYHN